MAEEIAITAIPPAAQPVTTEAAAISPTQPVAEPVVVTETVVEPAIEKVAEEKPVEAPKEETSLLSKDKKEIPAEKPSEEKAEVSQSDEPAPLPTYESFIFPEGVTVDNERIGKLTGLLGKIELAKGDHAELQKSGQELVDLHISELQTALQRQNEYNVQYWKTQRTEWANEFKNDPTYGGNRLETSKSEAKEFIKTHGGSEEHIDAFYDALEATGAADHPAVIRFILNVKNSSTFKTPQQLAAPKPVSEPKSKIAKRYGSSS